MAEPRIVKYLSLNELKALREAEDPPEYRIGGLTKMRHVIAGKGVISFALLADHTVCAQIAKYNFDVAISEVTIYVAREFTASRCSFNAVFEHEMKHVNEAKSFLQQFTEKVSTHVKDYFRQRGVAQARSEEEARENIESNYDKLNAYLKNLGNEILRNTVDTPEEINRVAATCDGETRRIFEEQTSEGK